MELDRAALLADVSMTGHAWCRAHSDLLDTWMVHLFDAARTGTGAGIALAAVGGYGRA